MPKTLPAPTGSKSSVSSYWEITAWIITFISLTAAIQVYTRYPVDLDTAYHAVVGQLIRKHGMLHAFPWTPFSWLADHYADKELLFHLLFVPLTGLNWITSAKIVGTVAGASALTAIYLVLRAEKVRFAGLWTIIPIVASYDFLDRFALVRPHLLSIALSFIVLWSASRGRLTILAIASAIYPWAYVAWHLPIILVLIAESAQFMSTGRLRWKPALVALCGILFGVALHPDSLNLIRLTWIQIFGVLFRNAWGAKEGFELGTEFLPASAETWTNGLMVAVFMLVTAFFLAWRNRRNETQALAFVLAAMAFGALTIKTYRFIEYFVPFSAIALALATRALSWRFLPHAILCVSAIYTPALNYDYLRSIRQDSEAIPQSTAFLLRNNIPEGAQVFSPDWLFTGAFMLALPDRRFIVALDPTFFYEKDPDLYRLWFSIPRDAVPDSAAIIRKRFKARYVLCKNGDEWGAFIDRLYSTPGVKFFLANDQWVLFDLGV